MNSKNVYIILSHPFTADNIGATARAMKNTGFSHLRLVAPRRNWKRRARVLARGAADILDSCVVYPALDDALADINWSVGTTRRISEKRGKFVPFEKFTEDVSKKSNRLKVGIIFGREAKGLSNEEIDRCDQLVSIPAADAYPSLNLAQAVMVVLFSVARKELRKKTARGCLPHHPALYLDKAGVQSTLQHFEKALKCIGFYGGKGGQLEPILWVTAAIFKRAGMLKHEAQMLKGVSARITQRVSANQGN